ncbi:SLC13 family permease [Haliangium ochraceum]|uniref:Anion transporter n=1 Tax=Haliangium ochraceum (strain DSM 14365 / JCM 11303 / SMP-2) TaxID=502025 RepID=D0LW20_HALO1|nr:DASS family sodium-coupled anion symporter [Haliangium ochraceum]ACY15952.1 anion transporter [Haliangium ochraceum DSM 14365]
MIHSAAVHDDQRRPVRFPLPLRSAIGALPTMMVDSRRALAVMLGRLEIRSTRRLVSFLVCIGVAALVTWVASIQPESGLSPAGLRGLFILVSAALLWVTEALPAFAVGILVIALEIALLGGLGKAPPVHAADWEEFVVVLGHPLIWLFFGGFILAAGAAKTSLDRRIATRLLPLLGNQRKWILAGCMGLTFAFSMFMSNTATTAMMLALLTPFLVTLSDDDRYAQGLLLGVAVAANLGGMGSLIGTPPNAIAVAAVQQAGATVSFQRWLLIGLPPALLMASLAWLLLVRRYDGRGTLIGPDGGSPMAALENSGEPRLPRWQRWTMVVTFVATVLLWMTGQWHGLPTAIVSFVPIVALTATGILGREDLQRLPWDVLFLLAGGLALGEMVQSTGVATWMVAHLPVGGIGPYGLALLMAYVCAFLSNLMSNTAAANVLVPIGVTLASGFEAQIAIPIAMGASAAMCLPISTPPNALVYASGRLPSRDFVAIGVGIGLLTPVIGVAWMNLVGLG